MMNLFEAAQNELPGTPLAEILRPKSLHDFLGQNHLTGAGSLLNIWIEKKFLPSLILWGPPGSGKTTLARLFEKEIGAHFINVSATDTGTKQIKELGEESKERRTIESKRTLLFIDEIHRLNKSQQDHLLPYVEKGDFSLIGATTENPSYELNRALMSRCRLIIFNRLDDLSLLGLIKKGFNYFNLDMTSHLSDDQIKFLIQYSDGDGRKLLNALERIIHAPSPLSNELFFNSLGEGSIGYDKSSDQHYDVLSAFIKSIRGSDPDAGLYYLARMLKAGEDERLIARRLIILASEDIGNAEPNALSVAVSGFQAVENVGLPEAAINLAQVVTYLASCPKSNKSYLAFKEAQKCVDQTGTVDIPLHLRSAQSTSMKSLGYGHNYLYPHDYSRGWIEQNYLPEKIRESKSLNWYEPSDHGFEKRIKEYHSWLKRKAP